MEINGEVYTSIFPKNFNKITTKIHVLWKCNQTTNQICNIQHQNLQFLYKVFTSLFLFPKCVFMNVLNFPKTPTLGHSPSHHQHEQQNSTRTQNSNPQLFNGLFLFIMPCKPQKLCNLPTLLTIPHTHGFFQLNLDPMYASNASTPLHHVWSS